MTEPRYCYANIAVATFDDHLKGFHVVRIWKSNPNRVEPVSFHEKIEETEQRSAELNAELGISIDDAVELLRSWISESNLGGADTVSNEIRPWTEQENQ